MKTTKKLTKQDRDDLRRSEIIAAARKCVVYKGFHATSMSEIAKSARMSVGHIYRYFDNKEAVIVAIVEKMTKDHLEWISSTAFNPKIADFHLKRINEKYIFDEEERALLLEIHAEAARNPAIAQVLIDSDKKYRDLAVQMVRTQIDNKFTDEELYVRVEIMASIFESFFMRSLKKPTADPEQVKILISKLVETLWKPDNS